MKSVNLKKIEIRRFLRQPEVKNLLIGENYEVLVVKDLQRRYYIVKSKETSNFRNPILLNNLIDLIYEKQAVCLADEEFNPN